MEEVIREGALRLLTSETSCDVILSCQGQRMMAHKVILSIASPILQDLLIQDISQPTVLIFPDVSGNTMSLILDYIYTGSVSVISSILHDFLIVANMLKLQLNEDYLSTHYNDTYSNDCAKDNANELNNNYYTTDSCNTQTSTNSKCNLNHDFNSNVEATNLVESLRQGSKKSLRKIPDLMPISFLKRRRELYNKVFPSPWCPRIAPVMADPRFDFLESQHNHLINTNEEKLTENDPNNNFKIISPVYPQPTYPKAYVSNKVHNYYSYSSPSKENVMTSVHYDDHKHHYPVCSPSYPIENLSLNLYTSQNPILPKIIPPLLEPLSLLPNLDKIRTDTNAEDKISTSLAPGQSSPKYDCIKTESEDQNERFVETISSYSENVKIEDKNDKIKPFKCQDCGKCFSQLRNFKYHRSIHEGTNEFSARCLECGKLFNDRGYLSSHMKIHRDRKEYACPHCPKRLNQRVAYNMHLRIHTGVKPHECPTCGKSFSRKMLLKQHQRVHTGERPYSCPECGKSFADRSNMSLHARLHTGIKPYACNICPKSFTKKHHLKTHMNFHTGLKPYSCQKCGLSFSQSSNMRTHYKKCILKPTNNTNTEKPA